jgi:hypothetical protein
VRGRGLPFRQSRSIPNASCGFVGSPRGRSVGRLRLSSCGRTFSCAGEWGGLTKTSNESAHSGSRSGQIVPSISLTRKNTGKIAEKPTESGGNWRSFEGQRRHFAVLRPECARLQHACLPDHAFTESGCRQRPLADRIGSRAPFFRRPKRETTYVGWGQSDDCADLVAALPAFFGFVPLGLNASAGRNGGSKRILILILILFFLVL